MFPQRWFKAEDHHADLVNFARNWRGDRTVHVLDCFGYSRSISRLAITKLADACRHLQKHDKYIQILAIYGNFLLGWPGAGLKEGGAIIAGPPCSLFVNACVSLHRRASWRLRGDESVWKVRLANRIWKNFAQLIKILVESDRGIHFLVEQPAQSWAFKQDWMKDAAQAAGMFVVVTWMAFFGTDLLKPTHLLTNLVPAKSLRRKMTKAHRLKFKARLEKRNLRRKVPRVYHKEIVKADGSKGWQGCKDLASSAHYTAWFAKAVLKCWEQSLNEVGSI
ncbi:unnamed protein product [Durusdinium trenchii]|uniref:Uncharacterized protein n=1 Tax=Durusdinium trenchii TaxID=1381693 RepID=A0ABP0I363_9DINO